MEKYLVTIEFRYKDAPLYEDGPTTRNKVVTIGIYDDFEQACIHGNNLLRTLESMFPLHRFPGGRKAPKERFSKNGGAFGSRKTLITNLAYLTTPFEFYAKIQTLKYSDIKESVNEVVDSVKRYRSYNLQNE